MTNADAKNEVRTKHLEMLQAVITRLAGNSFEVRKWSVGIVSFILGFTVDKADWHLAALAFVAAMVFWYLDSFYLYQERSFRTLFERVRNAPLTELEATPYFLNPDWDKGAIAFPPPTGVTIPPKETVFGVAFRDGLIELHWLALVVCLFAMFYYAK
jgi:hypothetical protein